MVRFPFTDLASSKRRPVLVISSREFTLRNGDVVVLALTSRAQPEAGLRLVGQAEAGLPRPTWIKPLIATLSARVVEKRLGRLAETDIPRVGEALGFLVDSSFGPPCGNQ